MHTFVGRQPIFDRQLNVYGYELLFRSGLNNSAGRVDDDHATSSVILGTFSDIGLERMVGKHRAFLNLGREFLLSRDPLPLPPERMVLEILENALVDADLVEAARGLSRQGFPIALDDFIDDPAWDPLLDVADIVKVEIPALDEAALGPLVARLKDRGLALLAEKVETREQFEHLHGLGFDYFQGYFLARPEVVSRRRPPTNRLAALRLVAELQRPDAEIAHVEAVLQRDVSLSYRLLRFINSAFFGLPKPVESIRHALIYLGLGPLKRWATLLTLAGMDDKPDELLHIALTRARTCELLCAAAGRKDADAGFITGLFSALDALLDQSLEDLVPELPLAPEVSTALLARAGALGEALACALAYERCDWDAVGFAGLSAEAVTESYTGAIQWTLEATRGLLDG